jgi:hypothetical protein
MCGGYFLTRERKTRERKMENVQLTPNASDAAPMLNIYCASIDAWQKCIDIFVQPPTLQQEQPTAARMGNGAEEREPVQLQQAVEEIFLRFVDEEIELCRFARRQWAQYLSFSSDISRCRSAADFAQMHLAFLTKLSADYGLEGRRLARTVQQMTSIGFAAVPAVFIATKTVRQ